MDNTATNNQAASSVEDTAHQTANNLLMDAVDAIGVIIPPHVDSPAAAILIAAHALIAKLDSMEASQLEALRDLRESIDFIAARLDGYDASDSLTAHERQIIFEALKAEYINSESPLNPKEQESALCDALMRFVKLSGL